MVQQIGPSAYFIKLISFYPTGFYRGSKRCPGLNERECKSASRCRALSTAVPDQHMCCGRGCLGVTLDLRLSVDWV